MAGVKLHFVDGSPMQPGRMTPLSVSPAIASLLLAVGVATVFSACGAKDDGTWMRCHAAQDAVLWVAVGMTAVLAVAAITRRGAVRAVLYAFGAIGSIAAFLIPGTIMPMCMMQTMRCYEVMQPFARIMAVVVFALCIVMAVRSWRARADALPKRAL